LNYKSKILFAFLFIVFFFVGWEITLPLVKEPSSEINSTPGYISENQFKIDVLHYDLDIDLYPEDKFLRGSAAITALILNQDITSIDLNLYDNLEIKKLLLNGIETDYTNQGTRLSIPLNVIKSDTFLVEINYEGSPKRAGLSAFVFGELNEKSVTYNLSEPTYASTWFPCNDIPDDKALLDIKITNDLSMTSVSNGSLVKVKDQGKRKTYHWKTVYPISTYLISIYSADYEQFSENYISQDKKDTMKIEYFVFPEHLDKAKKDFEGHPEIIDFFAKTFGEYPFIKEKYGVAEFLWQLGAMENQTITGIGSNFVTGRRFFDDVYVHELAHHWWGNAVGPETWKDIWLNEGFSTYSEALYAENIGDKEALQSTMLAKFQENFHGRLYDPGNNIFSQTIYDKGAWVLHMLRWETGDSNFFNILRDYFENFKYKNASTNDFKHVCESVSGKDLTKFFDQWVFKGEDQINLEYNWFVENEGNLFKLEIVFNQTQKLYNTYYFPLEIEIVFADSIKRDIINIKSRNERVKLTLNEKPVNIKIDPDYWLLANYKETGPVRE
jgi:aminopeptidase N